MINGSLPGQLVAALGEEALDSRLGRRLQGSGGRRRHEEDDGVLRGVVDDPIERRPCLPDTVGADDDHWCVVLSGTYPPGVDRLADGDPLNPFGLCADGRILAELSV